MAIDLPYILEQGANPRSNPERRVLWRERWNAQGYHYEYALQELVRSTQVAESILGHYTNCANISCRRAVMVADPNAQRSVLNPICCSPECELEYKREFI